MCDCIVHMHTLMCVFSAVCACVRVDYDALRTLEDRAALQLLCFFFLIKVQILSPKLWRPG